MAQSFRIKRFPLTTSWASAVPLVVPMDCSRIVIECEDLVNGLQIRSDVNDPDSEKGIPAGMEFEIRSYTQTAQFVVGATVCYMIAVAGAGPAVVSFTR